MSALLENPAQELQAWLDRGLPRVLIGLAGLPGSGKTTLTAHLAAQGNALAGTGAIVALGMDGFHLSRAALRQMPQPEEALARRGAPWTFDAAALAMRLRLLRENAGREAVLWPGFEHEIGDPVEGASVVAPSTRLILVEGLYLCHQADGWEEVRRLFDARWYLDTPLDLSLARLADRHQAVWGLTRGEAEARIAANDRLNAEIVAQSRAFADCFLTGDL